MAASLTRLQYFGDKGFTIIGENFISFLPDSPFSAFHGLISIFLSLWIIRVNNNVPVSVVQLIKISSCVFYQLEKKVETRFDGDNSKEL